MSRDGSIQGVVDLQNQNYLGKESLKCSSKSNKWPENANDSHNFHDENHDEIELYQGNNNRSTQWHSTPEQRTPQNESYRLWWGAADQCTLSHGAYIHNTI